MAKNKKMSQERFICRICGKDILGDHVIIQTKRHTTMHIHYECMKQGGRSNYSRSRMWRFGSPYRMRWREIIGNAENPSGEPSKPGMIGKHSNARSAVGGM